MKFVSMMLAICLAAFLTLAAGSCSSVAPGFGDNTNVNPNSPNDDGTLDQGQGDNGGTVTPGDDDGTADQGSGDNGADDDNDADDDDGTADQGPGDN